MRKIYFLFLFSILYLPAVWAQPSNDECVNAIPLDDITLWCSSPDAFTTVNATVSPEDSPSCFPNNQNALDVWFSFTAIAPIVSISVIGETDVNDGGTIQDPQFALYEGTCDNLGDAIACASDNSNADQVTIFESGLTIGQTYYIRVSARFNQTGTFELCVNNFNEVPPPDGDCDSAVILCDKSPFSVAFVLGVGNTPNEIGDVSCSSGTCPFDESSSTWYKWTCQDSGPLAFTLTPLNPADDLDFVVFELPNGLDDCSGKQDLRCMASGENVGAPFAEWAPCTGQTGLSLADPDIGETCGCQPGNNNFAQAVDMVAGRSYALVVNNFSQSGAGFSIEFDQSPGTGTFVGPEANFVFEPSIACIGETILFTDASSFIGNIDSYTWDFGTGAVPRTATGEGPHGVVYNTPGIKPVILEVTSERGCIVTRINLTTEVVCCDDHFTTGAIVSDVDCPDSTDGAIDFLVSNDYGPYGYAWSNGANTEDLTGLAPGVYTVTVVDEATCQDAFSFVVDSPPPFTFDTLVVMPTCNGGTDGAVTLVVNGGTPPYQYNWQNMGFGPDNTLSNISQGDYTVIVRDANGCQFTQVLPVRELELQLDPTVQTITPPSCFGFSDGSIVIVINNGLPPYEYNFNDGNGFTPNNTLNNISAGTYQVDVLDANLCSGFFELVVEDYPPLTLDFAIDNVSCFGESDGTVEALVTGGFGSYAYNWSNGANGAINGNLIAGTYDLQVTDENNCLITGEAIVTQPDSLGLGLVEVIDNICFGESAGSIEVEAVGGSPPYEYSIDGFTFQTDPILDNLPAGNYEVTVLDAEGCTATVAATVTQPLELIVDAGGDRFIVLGFDTLVRAVSNYSPVTYTWTPMDSLSCLNPDCSLVQVDPTSTTTYQVLVTNENGCTATDEVTIRVIKDRPVFIPNVFSPNNDGSNDGFTIFSGPGLELIEKLQIFSRWGELVFEANNIFPNDEGVGWDGQFNGEPVNPGVFVYLAQLRFVDEEIVEVKGDVTLIR
ncbi:gliding motility-associated C-terminal domain-containing protein [Lewinella sp. LCG006]|uniref:T9SS type B sorting domain-containing protein n=1 Tax=Lewinella sp. LCG006 TaxID=3231911 RepID=UPI00345F1FCC